MAISRAHVDVVGYQTFPFIVGRVYCYFKLVAIACLHLLVLEVEPLRTIATDCERLASETSRAYGIIRAISSLVRTVLAFTLAIAFATASSSILAAIIHGCTHSRDNTALRSCIMANQMAASAQNIIDVGFECIVVVGRGVMARLWNCDKSEATMLNVLPSCF